LSVIIKRAACRSGRQAVLLNNATADVDAAVRTQSTITRQSAEPRALLMHEMFANETVSIER